MVARVAPLVFVLGMQGQFGRFFGWWINCFNQLISLRLFSIVSLPTKGVLDLN